MPLAIPEPPTTDELYQAKLHPTLDPPTDDDRAARSGVTPEVGRLHPYEQNVLETATRNLARSLHQIATTSADLLGKVDDPTTGWQAIDAATWSSLARLVSDATTAAAVITATRDGATLRNAIARRES